METRSPYNVKQQQVSTQCFRPFAAGWKAPTGDEIACVMSQAITPTIHLTDTFGLSPGQVESWLKDKELIPYSIWCLLGFSAGYGEFWLPRK